MKLNDYQKQARKTKVYPDFYAVYYPTLSICGEVGELANKVKKAMRGDIDILELRTEKTYSELGDVLWYLANICTDLDCSLEDIAKYNLAKLKKRQEENKIKGDGDDR